MPFCPRVQAIGWKDAARLFDASAFGKGSATAGKHRPSACGDSICNWFFGSEPFFSSFSRLPWNDAQRISEVEALSIRGGAIRRDLPASYRPQFVTAALADFCVSGRIFGSESLLGPRFQSPSNCSSMFCVARSCRPLAWVAIQRWEEVGHIYV